MENEKDGWKLLWPPEQEDPCKCIFSKCLSISMFFMGNIIACFKWEERSCVVGYTCNPKTQDAEAEGSAVSNKLKPHSKTLSLQK